MEPWLIILLVAVGLFAIWLAFILLCAAFSGAVALLVFAAAQGFVGIAAYIACWVIFFPVMLVISVIMGLIIMLAARTDS
ncbi:MAG: hypothetical protein DHS20C03_02700 [Minwuia thermotolerans]|nr:MAG: hypothetical protein DHS20C03_02700 [Minwuia thermotolerans]